MDQANGQRLSEHLNDVRQIHEVQATANGFLNT